MSIISILGSENVSCDSEVDEDSDNTDLYDCASETENI
jgi:hypothetical protein